MARSRRRTTFGERTQCNVYVARVNVEAVDRLVRLGLASSRSAAFDAALAAWLQQFPEVRDLLEAQQQPAEALA